MRPVGTGFRWRTPWVQIPCCSRVVRDWNLLAVPHLGRQARSGFGIPLKNRFLCNSPWTGQLSVWTVCELRTCYSWFGNFALVSSRGPGETSTVLMAWWSSPLKKESFCRRLKITCKPNVNTCGTQILTVICCLIRFDTGNSAVNELYAQLYTNCIVRATFFFFFVWFPGVWFCFPLYFLVLRLFSGFVFGFSAYLASANEFPVCLFYGLFSGFVFWFYGLVSGCGFGVSAYLRLVRSWILSDCFPLYFLALRPWFRVSACHGDMGFGFHFRF